MPAPMKKFLVFHDYGTEGWKIQAACDDIFSAVMAREADLSNAGGRVIIVEYIDELAAYRRADYDRPKPPVGGSVVP